MNSNIYILAVFVNNDSIKKYCISIDENKIIDFDNSKLFHYLKTLLPNYTETYGKLLRIEKLNDLIEL